MNDYKHCPYCGEEIKINAKKCKHCGEWLIPEKDRPATQVTQKKPLPQEEEKTSPLEWISAIVVMVLSFAASLWLPILIGIFAVLFVPDENAHIDSINTEVVELIQEESNDWLDVLGGSELSGIANLLINNDVSRNSITQMFEQQNRIEVSKGWFWSTGKIYNRIHPNGEIASWGMFGFVIPLIEWNDIALIEK